ncbi:MAG: pyruvate dehydrogenase complex dihydrolipoamide acetyltransferase [Deltaproteobacteria bacterium]|nr:MAG: pyruvate dehydrogenase complex dihydrolipoamide acetyltransferase [Deltaproteobacteria bacterium]
MAQIIGLPKLSPTMEEGVLVRWAKKEGDRVEPGDLVAEIETDKANMDFTLEDEGVLLKLLVDEGETVKLGAPVAILGEEGEDVSALLDQVRAQAAPGSGPAAAPATEATGPARPDAAAPDSPATHAAPAPAPPPAATPAPAEPSPAPSATAAPRPADAARPAGRLLASPLAKTLALELGVDLRAVRGTGPGGRIVERDVRAAAQAAAAAPAAGATSDAAAAPAPDASGAPDSRALAVVAPRSLSLPPGDDDYVDRPLSAMRKTIARRLTEAKQTVPHFYLTAEADAEPLLAFRAALNKLVPADAKVSINDLIVKAVALALRRVPECNASFAGDALRYYARVHIGVAVALDDGLVTPVVRDADIKSIGTISAEIRDLARRARGRQLKAHEITGSTFSVSNLGMFGIDHFEAVINPPEGAILAVGTIRDAPVVDRDRVRPGKRMALTMSCDHRVIDGALGARFLDELVDLLQQPERLAL